MYFCPQFWEKGAMPLFFHVHLRKWVERFTFLILFFVMTWVFVQGMTAWSDWIKPKYIVHKPQEDAVMVNGKLERFEQPLLEQHISVVERLKLFFWLGE